MGKVDLTHLNGLVEVFLSDASDESIRQFVIKVIEENRNNPRLDKRFWENFAVAIPKMEGPNRGSDRNPDRNPVHYPVSVINPGGGANPQNQTSKANDYEFECPNCHVVLTVKKK